MTSALRFAPVDSFPGNATDAALLEDSPCALCGADDREPLQELLGFQFFTDDDTVPKRVDVRHVRCRRCGLFAMHPRYSPAGFRRLFAEAGFSFGAPTGRVRDRAAWLLERVVPAEGAVVVDLGCHEGEVLAHLPASLRRVGLDADAGAIERGRRAATGLELRVADLVDLGESIAELAPAAVSLFHVLEHLPEPVGVLRRLRSAVPPACRLVVEVPVLDEAVAEDVVGFFSIHHVTHFTRASLLACLAASGWELLAASPTAGGGLRVCATPGASSEAGGCDAESEARAAAYLAAHAAAVERAAQRLPDDAEAPCVIWGAGNHTEMLYHRTTWFRAAPSRPLALVDADPTKAGRSWRGVPIHAPADLVDLDWSATRLVISSYGGTPAIAAAARELGVPAGRLVRLYGPRESA